MTAKPSTTLGRILVVDDQAANLRAVSTLLARHGYDVRTADSGAQAMALARECQADLMLLDMVMPGMDGFALLAQIKQDAALRRLPVVFLTAAHDRELLVRAFDAGAVDYVTKPFMPEELLARVSAQVGLKQTRDRLERVARERQELVTLVAHDLKNPLTSVLFASDVLRSGGARPERVPRYLQMIHESAQDALGYIRRYLETQAAQARGTDDRQDDGTCVAWRELLDWLHDRYALQLEARGLQLNIAAPETDASAAMDGVVLRQVVENLVTNAMKYAPGSDVDLSLRNGSPGYWQLHVEDRGPGIPAAHRTQLFMPFMRLQEGDDPLSSGLGLSLARQILEGAGGSLWYEDRDGGGARFVVEVPAASETSIRAVG